MSGAAVVAAEANADPPGAGMHLEIVCGRAAAAALPHIRIRLKE